MPSEMTRADYLKVRLQASLSHPIKSSDFLGLGDVRNKNYDEEKSFDRDLGED